MEQLPDDLLADVLGRLPPSSLAASRCVRKHWCSIIDARRLLRADLLPLRLEGFYCTSLDSIGRLTYLYARRAPAARRRIPGGTLGFLENYYILEVEDHCNGLLLLCDGRMVVNPATRQWAELPASPEPSSIGDMLVLLLGGLIRVWADTTTDQDDWEDNNNHHHHLLTSGFYLVYDPMAESSQQQHFEVFLFPILLAHDLADITMDLDEQEWPLPTFRTHVFSSRTWRWEERSWIRQGDPAGTMADMLRTGCWDLKPVYFRGALYVHCQNHSVMRIALSNDQYQMIRSPATLSELGAKDGTFYLGKSQKGVYYALLYRLDGVTCPQFRVWWLKEEEEIKDGNHIIHMQWMLKANISLPPLLADKLPLHSDSAGDIWGVVYDYSKEEVQPTSAHGDDEFAADDEWDFENADIVLDEAKDNKPTEFDKHYPIEFLGFHPYKEIVFFDIRFGTVSYNLNTSKVQRLGDRVIIPVGMRMCFPYTPCSLMLAELFQNN